jgi:hypothetical protein
MINAWITYVTMALDQEKSLDLDSTHGSELIYNRRIKFYVILCILNITDFTDTFVTVVSYSK